MPKVKMLRGSHSYRSKEGKLVTADKGDQIDMSDDQITAHGPMRVEKVATGPGRPRKTGVGSGSASVAAPDGSAEG